MGKICPICGLEFIEPNNEDVEFVGSLLAKKYNSELSLIYPHLFKYCACGMVDCELSDEQLKIVKENKETLSELINQSYDLIDEKKYARVAECRGYIYELLNDNANSTLAYKASLDIIESELEAFEQKHLKALEDNENEESLLDSTDIECYSDVKMYVETLRRLVADVSAKSFEKLGYLGILIHLDTIINFNDFRIPDKMFALLNDETTKIPESLNKAKNQIEDRYLKIRKSSISRK